MANHTTGRERPAGTNSPRRMTRIPPLREVRYTSLPRAAVTWAREGPNSSGEIFEEGASPPLPRIVRRRRR
jgi:hypothetical protein